MDGDEEPERGMLSISPSMQHVQSSSPPSTPTRTATATTPLRPPDSKRKRCQVCPSSKDRKTNVLCFNCKKYLCKEHTKSVTFCHTCI
ncbi:hypothetical protein VZT92_002094 [Zoarces viviparus]|uniref:PiggyBac transposable element-derived protein 4 C-terminal zinc-ribbon domain-containing protein n=1 Tax=Zoarces viviparus TaxID=48416 RepID=A0AAW1G5F4_ZOAVI